MHTWRAFIKLFYRITLVFDYDPLVFFSVNVVLLFFQLFFFFAGPWENDLTVVKNRSRKKKNV